MQDSLLAYNRLGFEKQCLHTTDLEHKEGLLNSTSYQMLVDICTHANTTMITEGNTSGAAGNTTSGDGNATAGVAGDPCCSKPRIKD
jgi:hypothetical protein